MVACLSSGMGANVSEVAGHRVVCADSLAEWQWGEVDCIIADPPYSERTHNGHDSVEEIRNHSALGYEPWDEACICAAVSHWEPHCSGWFVVITDHVLAPIWETILRDFGRYAFAPLPFVSVGSRVRLAGDGPSSWTCWIVAARPKHEPYSKWGTLPGAYIFPPERGGIVGGKPQRLINALVADYSRPGDLVCDPCCGAGTLGRACMDLGRRSLQIDINPEHCELSRRRLAQQVLPGIASEA